MTRSTLACLKPKPPPLLPPPSLRMVRLFCHYATTPLTTRCSLLAPSPTRHIKLVATLYALEAVIASKPHIRLLVLDGISALHWIDSSRTGESRTVCALPLRASPCTHHAAQRQVGDVCTDVPSRLATIRE